MTTESGESSRRGDKVVVAAPGRARRYLARMSTRALHLLAYDVAHPKRLRRALHLARQHATGGQKSAHECWITGGERAALLRGLGQALHPRADRMMVVRLDPRLPPRGLGIAQPPQPPGFRIIG